MVSSQPYANPWLNSSELILYGKNPSISQTRYHFSLGSGVVWAQRAGPGGRQTRDRPWLCPSLPCDLRCLSGSVVSFSHHTEKTVGGRGGKALETPSIVPDTQWSCSNWWLLGFPLSLHSPSTFPRSNSLHSRWPQIDFCLKTTAGESPVAWERFCQCEKLMTLTTSVFH